MDDRGVFIIACLTNKSLEETEQKIKDFVQAVGGKYEMLVPQIYNYVRDFGEFPSSLQDLKARPLIQLDNIRSTSKINDRDLRKTLDISLVDR